jgi:hypothetical protein
MATALLLIKGLCAMFAQMSDPLTALMHAVQVMNLLKTLITRTIKDREADNAGTPSSKDEHHDDDDRSLQVDAEMKKFDSAKKSLASEGGDEFSVRESNKALRSPYFPERLSSIQERRDEDDEMSVESQGPFSSRSRSSTWSSIDANLGAANDEDKPGEMHVKALLCVNNDMKKLCIGKETSGSVDDSDSHTKSFSVCPVPGSVRTHKAKAKVGVD